MTILAMDLSLNCPGFAVLDIADGKVKLIEKTTVNNIRDAKKEACRRKSTPQKLREIAQMIQRLIAEHKPELFVRERGFSRHNVATQTLFRVVGVSDLVVYEAAHQEIYEIAPSVVKRLVAGSGSAEKIHIERELDQYIGFQLYGTQDESDAVAVGIAWAIQEGWIKQDFSPRAKNRMETADKVRKTRARKRAREDKAKARAEKEAAEKAKATSVLKTSKPRKRRTQFYRRGK